MALVYNMVEVFHGTMAATLHNGTLHNGKGFQWHKALAQILIWLVLAEYTAAALLCLQEA